MHRDRTLQDSIHQHYCTLRNDQRPVLSRKTVSRGEQCACVPGITVGMDRGGFLVRRVRGAATAERRGEASCEIANMREALAPPLTLDPALPRIVGHDPIHHPTTRVFCSIFRLPCQKPVIVDHRCRDSKLSITTHGPHTHSASVALVTRG